MATQTWQKKMYRNLSKLRRFSGHGSPHTLQSFPHSKTLSITSRTACTSRHSLHTCIATQSQQRPFSQQPRSPNLLATEAATTAVTTVIITVARSAAAHPTSNPGGCWGTTCQLPRQSRHWRGSCTFPRRSGRGRRGGGWKQGEAGRTRTPQSHTPWWQKPSWKRLQPGEESVTAFPLYLCQLRAWEEAGGEGGK